MIRFISDKCACIYPVYFVLNGYLEYLNDGGQISDELFGVLNEEYKIAFLDDKKAILDTFEYV